MSGQLCMGTTYKNAHPGYSRAFCEGMAHRASDTALNAPKTDNPYSDPDGELEIAWDNGWDAADAEAGNDLTKATAGCCALVGTTVQV